MDASSTFKINLSPPAHVELGAHQFFHGTKADLRPRDLLLPRQPSNHDERLALSHVYFTQLFEAAAWGAELARGDGAQRIYIVEPTGEYHDDPNLTDKKFPGNPTRSYRSSEPVRIIGEVTGWTGHSPEEVARMKDSLAALRAAGGAAIID